MAFRGVKLTGCDMVPSKRWQETHESDPREEVSGLPGFAGCSEAATGEREMAMAAAAMVAQAKARRGPNAVWPENPERESDGSAPLMAPESARRSLHSWLEGVFSKFENQCGRIFSEVGIDRSCGVRNRTGGSEMRVVLTDDWHATCHRKRVTERAAGWNPGVPGPQKTEFPTGTRTGPRLG